MYHSENIIQIIQTPSQTNGYVYVALGAAVFLQAGV